MFKSRTLTTLIALNAVSALSHCAQFGVLYPLLALWLNARGVPAWEVGLVGSLYWSGMLIGSAVAPSVLHQLSPKSLIMIAAVMTASAALLMSCMPVQGLVLPVWLVWGGLGAVVGCATGFRWVANESWLYSLVSPGQRGTWVGWHETLIHAMQTLGPVIIAYVGLSDATGFYWAAVFAIGMVIAVWGATVPMPRQVLDQPTPRVRQVLQGVWAGLRGANSHSAARIGLWSGVVDGVLFGMFAVYCTMRGHSSEQAAMMMVVFGFGGLVTSLPLGMLCDRKGVRFTLRWVCALGGVAVLCLLFPSKTEGPVMYSYAALIVASALLGVLAGVGLTLSMIVGTAHASASQSDMGQAVSEVSLAFTAGTMIGPVCAGLVLDGLGVNGYLALVVLLCVLGALIQIEIKKDSYVTDD